METQNGADIIDVRNLIYTYPKTSQPAVKGVTFSVQRGEIFGLLGPSGAGKSTIQKVLTHQFRKLQHGAVSVLGRDIQSWGADYYEKIGVGFELPNHFLRLTGAENLRFFASLYKSETRDPLELLELVGLGKAANVRVSDYSKGMMMRLNFVRALVHDPDLLFFDEPTSGLDPVNARIVKQIIFDQRSRGKTVVLTTHNMFDVEELCDRCGFMVRGQMAALDTVETLKARYGQRNVEMTYLDHDNRTQTAMFPLDGLGANPNFQSALNGYEVQTIHSQEATLDQVFVEVTGVDLQADDELPVTQ
ncbi:ABC transporter ATP-binding protein [uncultured Hyphomonas sp.]|uniref:ABC transporter ATP-binding protein n=1 Tax=uncultured Hyphomonas sp. TaxID=225298 RepID=UPI002AAA8668|nr:ABC transporter ATP-binding protein [uncultured Hyphomonas sp.]